MFCAKCGGQVESTNRFCGFCGTAVISLPAIPRFNTIQGLNEVTVSNPQSSRLAKRVNADALLVHPDIVDLIWIADGAKANYTNKPISSETYNHGSFQVKASLFGSDEPSLIYTKMPVETVDNISSVERPPYYPRYEELTPQQKGVYWKLLADPYNPDIDIGFVFILYYGLERHLFCGNLEKAFRVILKLRDVHKNKSFQQYSGNALVLTCLCKQRSDMLIEFLQSIDKEYEYQFSGNLFIMCKYGLGVPLFAKDIMRLSKAFNFTNQNYIKKQPELFESLLAEKIRDRYNTNGILISSIIDKTEFKKCRSEQVLIFSNVSIEEKFTEVPMLVNNSKFMGTIYSLLCEVHEEVKGQVSKLGKK